MSWEEFKKGHYSDDGKDEDSKEQMNEDEDKFKFADEDGDGKLDLEEYMAFYHPGVSKQVDCKTIRIFAYSGTRVQSNKRSAASLKTESESGERLLRTVFQFCKRDARPSQ